MSLSVPSSTQALTSSETVGVSKQCIHTKLTAQQLNVRHQATAKPSQSISCKVTTCLLPAGRSSQSSVPQLKNHISPQDSLTRRSSVRGTRRNSLTRSALSGGTTEAESSNGRPESSQEASAGHPATSPHKSHWEKLGRHAPGHVDPEANHAVLGIDFGGTGIKGAPVDIVHGTLLQPRFRIPTPSPATPKAVAGVINEIRSFFQWSGPIGVGMPSVVRRGVVRTSANIDSSWVDVRAQEMFEKATGCPVGVLNDADAAGYAEMLFGAGRAYQKEGVLLMLTFGTGIGTALFVNGNLVPNLEMGHIEVDGCIAEKWASGAVREREEMSWKKWAGRANIYLERMEHYLQPDAIVIGGGISKKEEKFMHLLQAPAGAKIVCAEMRNEAGIVGAALGGSAIMQRQRAAEEERVLVDAGLLY